MLIEGLLLVLVVSACANIEGKESAEIGGSETLQSFSENEIDPYDVSLWSVNKEDGEIVVAQDTVDGANGITLPVPENVDYVSTSVVCEDATGVEVQYIEGSEEKVRSNISGDGTRQGLVYEFPLKDGSVVMVPSGQGKWSYQIVVKEQL